MLTWQQLKAIDFGFNQTLQLSLADDTELVLEEVLRIVPKVRLVAMATWQNKPVVAKLFFSPRAKQAMQKELSGIEILQKNHVPTPKLYYQGSTKDKNIWVMLFERVMHAKSLEALIQEHAIDELFHHLQAVVKELATQHVYGIVQHDIHFKNYLVSDKIIYTLDGGEVTCYPTLLTKKQSMEHLALFLAQLGIGLEAYQEKLFLYYAKLRGWLLKSDDVQELFRLIAQCNHRRWQRYQKKIFRASSDFVPIGNWQCQGMALRKYLGPEFLAFLKNPDAVFNTVTQPLKAGRSATVIQVFLDGHHLTIKRYNIKNFWHLLRRILRATRARLSWRLSQKLSLFHLKTAKPIAYLENKFLIFHGKSYYVSEYIAGSHLGEYLHQFTDDENRLMRTSRKIIDLLKNLAKLALTHGDLKMTNILIDEGEQPVLIDLDGGVEHTSLSSLHHAWHQEAKRFLDNYKHYPELQEKLSKEIYSYTNNINSL